MSELVFHKIQLGVEGTEGTAVPATVVFPCDPGAVTELDRSPQNPVEDFGVISEQQSTRGAYGVRLAKMTLPALMRFQDIMPIFEMGLAGGVTPALNAGYYTWTYAADDTTDTLKSRTIEEGTTDGQFWQLKGALVDQFTLEFGPITAPGDYPWKVSATLLARDKQPITVTAGLSAPSNLETMQGHLSTLAIGSNSVAFASLPAVSASLIAYKLTVNNNLKMRIYGGATDTATAHGRMHRQTTIDATVKVSGGTKNPTWDIFNTAGATVTEERARVAVTGSGSNGMTIDHRIRYTAVALGDRDGERTFQITGVAVKDSTLASDVSVAVTNQVASIQ